MREILYDVNSILIAAFLFVSMALTIAVGYRVGLRTQVSANDAFKTHVVTTQPDSEI